MKTPRPLIGGSFPTLQLKVTIHSLVCTVSLFTWLCYGDVYQNPTGPLISPTGGQVKSDQFIGARFQFSSPVDVSSISGRFGNLNGSYFAALVPLSSLSSLPHGNPPAGIPFNAGEVLSYRTFTNTF